MADSEVSSVYHKGTTPFDHYMLEGAVTGAGEPTGQALRSRTTMYTCIAVYCVVKKGLGILKLHGQSLTD